MSHYEPGTKHSPTRAAGELRPNGSVTAGRDRAWIAWFGGSEGSETTGLSFLASPRDGRLVCGRDHAGRSAVQRLALACASALHQTAGWASLRQVRREGRAPCPSQAAGKPGRVALAVEPDHALRRLP